MIAAMLLSVNVLNAQVVRKGNTFSVKQNVEKVDSTTKYTWEDNQGNTLKVYKTKTSFYIWRKSKKTGRMYRMYLPKEVQEIMRAEYNMKSNKK